MRLQPYQMWCFSLLSERLPVQDVLDRVAQQAGSRYRAWRMFLPDEASTIEVSMALRYARGLRVLAVLVLELMLVACGEAAGSPAVVVPSQASTTSVVTTAAPATTVAPSLFAALPQSRTAEGYYVLGKPDAPSTIEFYSDFL
jgi:hypothetical protein